MELNITNKDADKLHQSFGISEERSTTLANQLDDIILDASLSNEDMNLCELYYKMGLICNTPEELIFCIITNVNYFSIAKFGEKLL